MSLVGQRICAIPPSNTRKPPDGESEGSLAPNNRSAYIKGKGPSMQVAESRSVSISTFKNGRARPEPVWIGSYRIAGKNSKRTLEKVWDKRGKAPEGYQTEADAISALDEFLAGLALSIASSKGVSFELVTEAYVAACKRRIHTGDFRHPTLSTYENIIATRFLPEWGERAVRSITSDEIVIYRARMAREGLAAGTLNQYRAVLRGIFATAIEDFDLEANPADAWKWTKNRRSASGAMGFYSPEEVMQLADAATNEQDACLFMTAAFTGLRSNELRELRWRWVDFLNEKIHVEAGYTDDGGVDLPKSYKVRSMPLMPQVAEALQSLRQREHFTGPDDLVFASDIGSWYDHSAFYRRFKKACRAIGLHEIRVHDLRHSFGTMAVQIFPLSEVQVYMGHADIKTTMRYIHHVPNVDAAARLGALVGPRKGSVVPLRQVA